MADPGIVDLRSDTVTRPSKPMREAMANAEVGDDVMGDDPTVRRLEERVAKLLGTETALFVPSGTMANQIGLRAHTQPGDEVIVGRDAHTWRDESGGLAANAGIQAQVLGEHFFTAADVRAAYKAPHWSISPSRVLAVENTHGWSGGKCWALDALAEVTREARSLGMATHLDGARLWNAAVATGKTERELAEGFDSVSVCLSKGLGAPVGSLIAGTRDFIKRCHRFRKMHGGGMRQAGILAAAGLYAIDHHRFRLAEDHANARAFAEALAGAANLAVTQPQTNIVMFELERGTNAALIEHARAAGVLLGAGTTARRVRAVTHLDVDRDGVLRAAKVIAEIAATL
jgi:threonine aldolase